MKVYLIPDRFLGIELSMEDYDQAIFKNLDIPNRFFSHGKSSLAQSIEEETKTDDPRIPNRFKKQDSRSSQNDHIRELVMAGKIPSRFLPPDMMANNFSPFK